MAVAAAAAADYIVIKRNYYKVNREKKCNTTVHTPLLLFNRTIIKVCFGRSVRIESLIQRAYQGYDLSISDVGWQEDYGMLGSFFATLATVSCYSV